MFDFKKYSELSVLEAELTAPISDEKQTVISADLVRQIYHLRAAYDADVKKAAELIEREAKFGVATIVMPTPLNMKGITETGEEVPVTITEYSRSIRLPAETEPYYMGVLFTEAEALYRDWCEICLENHKVAS